MRDTSKTGKKKNRSCLPAMELAAGQDDTPVKRSRQRVIVLIGRIGRKARVSKGETAAGFYSREIDGQPSDRKERPRSAAARRPSFSLGGTGWQQCAGPIRRPSRWLSGPRPRWAREPGHGPTQAMGQRAMHAELNKLSRAELGWQLPCWA